MLSLDVLRQKEGTGGCVQGHMKVTWKVLV